MVHVIGLVMLAWVVLAACALNIEPPRQNEHFTDPPARYGDTVFSGLRAPGGEQVDSGTGDPNRTAP